MTNERAIELLNRISDSQFDGQHGDERREALEMAVRALFSQQIVNDSQGLVNDCISRKAAIDEIDEWIKAFRENGHKESAADACLIQDGIIQLPSAQPERQVELDGTESNIEILSELRAQFNCFNEVEEPCYRALSDAICALSAQPERKNARWEILYPNHTYKYHCSECGANHKYMFDFCPSCGADMRGESDE